MARSPQEIAQSMRNTFAETNPSIDTKVGASYDFVIAPLPKEFASVEQEVERVTRYYSAEFPDVASSREALDFATNFSVSASYGERSSGNVTFFRYSPPPAGVTLTVPVGLVVGTKDSQYLFRTVETKTMIGDAAATYFNPQTNRYEISILIQAVAPGVIYDLPPSRITRILSGSLLDFDGVFQPTQMSGGTEAESSRELALRTISQFKGINLNSTAGVALQAKRFKPTGILASSIIRSTDRFEFRRPTSSPALDLCVKGTEIQTFTEDYFASGGETVLVLQNPTANSIVRIAVNNVGLDPTFWSFLPDTTPEYRGSTRAKQKIQLDIPLTANDVVEIVGTKNFLLDRLQSSLSANGDKIFATDILVRSFVDLMVVVGLELKLKKSPQVSVADVESKLTSIVTSYIEPSTFIPSELDVEGLKTTIREVVPEVDSIKVFEFRRRESSIAQVEIVPTLKNQIPRFDVVSSSLIVRS